MEKAPGTHLARHTFSPRPIPTHPKPVPSPRLSLTDSGPHLSSPSSSWFFRRRQRLCSEDFPEFNPVDSGHQMLPRFLYKRPSISSTIPLSSSNLRRRQAVEIHHRRLAGPRPFAIKFKQHRKSPSPISGLVLPPSLWRSRWCFHFGQTCHRSMPAPTPEGHHRQIRSGLASPSLLEALDLAVLAFKHVVTFCYPSASPPSPGSPRTPATITSGLQAHRRRSEP
jgi:hypothetical protein